MLILVYFRTCGHKNCEKRRKIGKGGILAKGYQNEVPSSLFGEAGYAPDLTSDF